MRHPAFCEVWTLWVDVFLRPEEGLRHDLCL
jgi:hypothetical protein